MPLRSTTSFARVTASVMLALVMAGTGPAQVRTLTDQLGRTIRAEVLSVEGDVVKIKREDGQLFDMPLANLSDDDQIALKAWARKNPRPAAAEEPSPPAAPAVTPASVRLNASRAKFSVDVTFKYDAYQDSYEDWGYNIEVTNTTLHPVEGLRVEYMIFGRLFASSTQTSQSGRQALDAIEARKSTSFRTKSFRMNKWKAGGYGNSGGQLNGVWIRLYAGDTLLHDYASPESLRTREKWSISRD